MRPDKNLVVASKMNFEVADLGPIFQIRFGLKLQTKLNHGNM
jgi:hypothetical protein